MHFLSYILVYPLLWFISLLPFRLLYIVSDGLYILLYYVVRYRKSIVTENLHLAFPDLPEKELLRIRRKFYKHFADMFLEMTKTMSISRKTLSKRFKIKNIETLKHLESLDKSILLMYGHYASWEWSVELQNHLEYRGFGIYKRLDNKYFDAIARDIRSKFNTTLITTKEAITTIRSNEMTGIKSIVAFLSDQSPKLSKEVYWGRFMGHKVPCFTGAERLAKSLDLSIAYLKINKVKRGYYEAEIITLTDQPKTYKDYELTDMFLRQVEAQIKQAPEYYFWTHRRWKHRHIK